MGDELYNVISDLVLNEVPSWQDQAKDWLSLGRDLGMNEASSPLTLKALYVVGLIIAYGASVDTLLNSQLLYSTTFYPAYILFAAMVDLLGRCIVGDKTTRKPKDNLVAGLKWLVFPLVDKWSSVSPSTVVVTTRNFPYTVEDLVAIRNFAAHGQALSHTELKEFDYLLLGEMPRVLAKAVMGYILQLSTDQRLAMNLAKAGILPYRNRPIFDTITQFHMVADAFPVEVGDLIARFNWRYRLPAPFGEVT